MMTPAASEERHEERTEVASATQSRSVFQRTRHACRDRT